MRMTVYKSVYYYDKISVTSIRCWDTTFVKNNNRERESTTIEEKKEKKKLEKNSEDIF